MTKLIMLLAVVAALAGCGQKGPLIVDQPIEEGQEQLKGNETTSINGTANSSSGDGSDSRLNRQLEGSSTIITR